MVIPVSNLDLDILSSVYEAAISKEYPRKHHHSKSVAWYAMPGISYKNRSDNV